MSPYIFRCTWAEGCSESVEVEAPGPTLAAMDAERAGWRFLSPSSLVGRWVEAACPECAEKPSEMRLMDDAEWRDAMISKDAIFVVEGDDKHSDFIGPLDLCEDVVSMIESEGRRASGPGTRLLHLALA